MVMDWLEGPEVLPLMDTDWSDDELVLPGALEPPPLPPVTQLAMDPLEGIHPSAVRTPQEISYISSLPPGARSRTSLAETGRIPTALLTSAEGRDPVMEGGGRSSVSADPSCPGLATPSSQGARATARRREERLGSLRLRCTSVRWRLWWWAKRE